MWFVIASDAGYRFGFAVNNFKRTNVACPDVARHFFALLSIHNTSIQYESAINKRLVTFLPILTLTFNAVSSAVNNAPVSIIYDFSVDNQTGMVTRTKKIFVGGLSAPTTLEDVKNYFEQFGPLVTLSMYRTSSPFPLVSQNRAALSTTVIHGIYIV
ncbi:RNA-binding protein Musashi like protein Rbp6 [Trachymyrmex septentrionalis]|uniref:RNA-binding protein Musashi like protein Rbp6 n=1 Tax=Trachymyrmex septentrionalis TaxID=34720 RepID=A0A195FN39_9HYME|nr:RNA-binding protein Musashi like protein Rbp6 [Trachymyrmex septentrionalis]